MIHNDRGGGSSLKVPKKKKEKNSIEMSVFFFLFQQWMCEAVHWPSPLLVHKLVNGIQSNSSRSVPPYHARISLLDIGVRNVP